MLESQRSVVSRWVHLALVPLFLSGSLTAQALPLRRNSASRQAPQGKPGTCRPVGNNCFDETFTAPIVSTQPLDLLFVVETSRAIYPELPAIQNGILKLIDALPNKLDLNIAVMLSHGSTSNWSGRLYQTGAMEPVVLRSKALSQAQLKNDLSQKLSNLTSDPDSAGGDEGLFSLFNGINSPSLLAASKAAGFFRPNAGLGIVFIADQRDICAIPPAGVPAETDPTKIAARIRDCEGLTVQGLSSRLKQLKGNQPLRVSGVIYAKPPVPPGSENEISYGYLEMVQINGGTAVDIDKDSIPQGLIPVVAGEGSSMPSFTLSHSDVDPASITVTVNGQKVSFQVKGNTVTLTQAVPSGANVLIHYCLRAGNLSSKAEKLAAIMAMSCPIPNKSYPNNYKAPTADEIWQRLRACTPDLYPETPTTAQQQKTLDRLLNAKDPSLRVRMFHKLWYSPAYSDHFEYYFGLEIKEAVQVFCLGRGGLPDVLITSEYAKAMYDQLDSWQYNPTEQRKWRFAQSLRQQLLSCLNR